MEPKHGDERRESNKPLTEPSAPPAKQAVFNAPFASEGLEQVRDSHC